MSIRITGINSGMDTDSMVQELVSAYKKKGETYTKEKTKMEWKQEAWEKLNKKVKSFYSKYVSNMKFDSNYNKKKTTVSNTSKASVIASANAVNGTQTLEVESLAKAAYLTGAQMTKADSSDQTPVKGTTKLSEIGFTGESVITINQGRAGEAPVDSTNFTLNEDMTIDDAVKLLSAAGYNANFDEASGRIFMNSKKSGALNNFDIVSDNDENLRKLGLKVETDGAQKVDGEDAKIILNNATFTSDTNSFSINGLTISVKEKTAPGEQVSLITDDDYDAVYDNIKDFFKNYNELINEMDALYNADSSKGFEPLTSEEKEAMSEDEVEKWEKKIKDALLRRDENVNSLANMMKQTMLEAYEIDGKKYSLSSFGINTLGYFNSEENQKNAYHIDGNKDDEATAGNEDKLKAMIATNPTAVSGFFKKLSTDLYNKMFKESKSSEYRSYGSFYDDKKLKKDIEKQQTKVDDWDKYVAEIEDKYYKQFTAMEKAMATLNSSQSQLQSMLGSL